MGAVPACRRDAHMGGTAAEEETEPGWCSGSSSMRAANILVLGHEARGARQGDEVPRAAGKGSSGVAAVAWGFWVALATGLAQSSSPSRRACSRIRKPCRREEVQSSNTAGRRMATSR